MSESHELLEAIKDEAVNRMTPPQLVERAVGLRAALHNMLEIEPLDVRGGTLYTVTSGIVAEAMSHVQTEVEEDEIVRRHVVPPLTLFADVVELPHHASWWHGQHDAKLYRVEQPLSPVQAEARGPFRSIVLEALAPGPNDYSPPIQFGKHPHVSYPAEKAVDTPAGTLLNAQARGAARIFGSPGATLHTQTVGTSELDSEIGVRTRLSGPVYTQVEPFQFALVTDRGVKAGPESAQPLQLTLPEGTPQYIRGIQSRKYERIPSDAGLTLDETGRVVMTGGRSGSHKYESVDLQPHLPGTEVSQLLPLETTKDWPDVTETILRRLRDRLPQVLPLDTAASWDQTIAWAREQVREALLTERTPVLGGVGNLAVAALMAELPASPGDHRPINKAYFTNVI